MAQPVQVASEVLSDPAPAPATENATTQMTPVTRSLRVLVADDVAMNREIAGSFLRSAGHESVCVDDGAEAVKRSRVGRLRRDPNGRSHARHGRP